MPGEGADVAAAMMMKNDLRQILAASTEEPSLRAIIAQAINFLDTAEIAGELGPNGTGQSAKQVSDLHAYRRKSGYYKEGAVLGLDETIASLAGAGSPNVHLGIIETRRGGVAIWLDDHGSIVGVLITKMIDQPKASDSLSLLLVGL